TPENRWSRFSFMSGRYYHAIGLVQAGRVNRSQEIETPLLEQEGSRALPPVQERQCPVLCDEPNYFFGRAGALLSAGGIDLPFSSTASPKVRLMLAPNRL